MNMNDPKDCPKRMNQAIEFLDRKMRLHKSIFIHSESPEDAEIIDQLGRSIALLKAHESMCECGIMPGDGNAALWDLERSLAGHKDMHTAFQGTPKGEYHAWAIREIEDALTVLRNSMEAPKESPVKKIGWGFSSNDPNRTVDQFLNESSRSVAMRVDEDKKTGLTFSEALEAVKRGKKVRRGASGITLKGGSDMDLNVSFGDIASTDWSIVEEP